ncbi:MAG: YidC/Oxa1 family membrane protein insertase [Anaerolineae bacterium]
MWDLLFLNPMINLLLLFYRFVGHSIAAIALLTLLVRLALLPLTLRQQRSAQRMRELQPELDKIQKKHASDPEKRAQAQMQLYRKAGINPLGGCLPLVIQFPLLIGLWQSIVRVLAVSPLELLKLSQNIWPFIPGLTSLVPLESKFLWLDLGQPDRYFVLPALVVVTSWLSQRILTPPATDQRSAAMGQQMQIMMPLLFGFISISYASGLSIYFIISNLITMLQYLLIRQGPLGKSET